MKINKYVGDVEMVYRRNEGFRYVFNNPIRCLFRISKIDKTFVTSEFGNGEIIDISPTGMKLRSSLNLSAKTKQIEIEIHFSIGESSFQIPGIVLWQQKEFDNSFFYGVKLYASNEVSSMIVEELKIHARNALTQKNEKDVHTMKVDPKE